MVKHVEGSDLSNSIILARVPPEENDVIKSCISFFLSFFFCLCLFRVAPIAFGGSQASGLIRVVAASLRHSHRNTESEPHLRPTLQLMATPDP